MTKYVVGCMQAALQNPAAHHGAYHWSHYVRRRGAVRVGAQGASAAQGWRAACRRRAGGWRGLRVRRASRRGARRRGAPRALTQAAHAQLRAAQLAAGPEPGAALARRARDLAAAADRLAAASAKAHTLLTSAHQRVKWGAGANPALAGVAAGLARAGEAGARAAALAAAATALAAHAHVAATHTHPPTHYAPLTAALAHFEKVDNVSALLREMIASQSAESAALRTRRQAAGDALRAAAARALPPPPPRAALLADVRAPLAVLAGCEGNNPAAEFMSREKIISEHLSALAAVARDADPRAVGGDARPVGGAAQAATYLLQHLAAHHDALQQLHNNWPSEATGRRLTRQAALGAGAKPGSIRQGQYLNVGATREPSGSPVRRITGRRVAGGERNAVGAGVWKRVRLKLEGRDEALGARRLALADHVDAVIRDAVSWGNLCHMYEGWMAWV
ncbi:hypothetical protein HF086_000115 [Spodoptera exigua]|uniref:FATC domain-containing protein n=1 Tax=Spodoptera exigua TaxID=7107 RepID=A0A922SKT4_SPOEX|nr:hypothetical protein HF086_000115 [Spodoptera exigua]